ncbi:hypothetical protein EC991_008622 [Linnemannia zychae]|nr:hypothetical protein EC991_008622 [Linnemannia zychae]
MPDITSVLDFDCIATDPGSTTIYGIAKYRKDRKNFIILLRSTSNLDHISKNMWSIVSTSPDKPLSYWGKHDLYGRAFRAIDCAVSSKGAFSAFFRDGLRLTPGYAAVPVGVRYDPDLRSWSSIRTSHLYGWTSDYWDHKSFYVNKNGVESAVHMLTDTQSTVIRFGIVNEANNILQLAGVWKKDETGEYIRGDVSDSMEWKLIDWRAPYIGLSTFQRISKMSERRTMYANGYLYITYYASPNDIIVSYPLVDPTTSPPPKDQVFKGPNAFASDRFFSGTRNRSTYLGGIGEINDWAGSYKTYTISNLNGVMQVGAVYTAPLYNHTTTSRGEIYSGDRYAVYDSFFGVGGHLEGQEPFVIGLTSLGTYEFSINAKNISNGIGILEGLLCASEDYSGPPAIGYLEAHYMDADQNRENTVWLVFGIPIAIAIGLTLLLKYVRYRRGHKSDSSNVSGRRVPQEFALRTLTHRTGPTRAGVATTAALHPSITHTDIAAYENAILHESDPSNDPPPEFVASLDNLDDSRQEATPLPPPTYWDDSQVPEYPRHTPSNTVIPISRTEP